MNARGSRRSGPQDVELEWLVPLLEKAERDGHADKRDYIILARWMACVTQREIGREVGLSNPAVCKIIASARRYKAWPRTCTVEGCDEPRAPKGIRCAEHRVGRAVKNVPCVSCGKLCFPPSATLDEEHICIDCRREHARRDCVHCGKRFLPLPGHRTSDPTRGRKYCSNDCYLADVQRARRQRYGTPKLACEVCGEEFWATGGESNRARFCSPKCYQFSCSRSSTKLDWHECPCGKWICKPGKKYCTNECKKEAAAARARRRRRAIRGTSLDITKVFERDNWHCCATECLIGNRKINPNISYPDSASASADHIIPLSHFVNQAEGHTYANMHTTHLRCNLSKHNRGGGEQLALFGGIDEPPTIKPYLTVRKNSRTCTAINENEDLCERPHLGRGLCKYHYHREYARRRRLASV